MSTTEATYRYSVEAEGYAAISEKRPVDQRHPESIIREHFPDAHSFRPLAMAGAWWFTATRREGELPRFFEEVSGYP